MANNSYFDDQDSFYSYVKEISCYPLLTADQEINLANKIDTDPTARDTLINSNLRLVIFVAKKYLGLGLSIMDIISEGNIGLIRAVDTYDPSRGARFSTYAVYWIRHMILKALSSQSRNIKVPTNVVEKLTTIKKIQSDFLIKTGEAATLKDISDQMGDSIEAIKSILSYDYNIFSLDGTFINKDNQEQYDFSDIIEDENISYNPEKSLLTKTQNNLLQQVLETLPKKEKRIIRLRFGFEDGSPKTLEETGQIMNLSAERVRQLENRAYRKLRNPSRFKYLFG